MGLEQIGHILLVLSGKGGVGKSSVSVQTALGLMNQGKRVALLDVDLCGPSIPRMLGIEEEFVNKTEEALIPVTVGNLKVTQAFGIC